MKVAITGASGFIGQYLIRRLRTRGHKAVVLTRQGGGKPATGVSTQSFPTDGPPDLRGMDAVVNLAGETILGWWTKAKKQRVIESRVGTTDRLVAGIKALPPGKGPRVLVSASAVGFYGDAGEALLDEGKPCGTGFLAEVARDWEAAAQNAEAAGVRVARVRFGVVLGKDGGAFPAQRKIFGLGIGGRLGDGQQWTSPVHVDDVVGLLVFLLERDGLAGAFNAVCPEPIRNADLTVAIGRAVHKPAALPVPALALRTLLGEASHIVLDSIRAVPARTLDAGFQFRFPTAAAILADVVRARPAGGDQRRETLTPRQWASMSRLRREGVHQRLKARVRPQIVP